MATILTKKSDTSSSVPLAADLTNAAGGAELAVNTADKRLYSKTSGGSVVELGTNPSALSLPNGTANGVPYLNGSKVLTSGSALTFDGTNLGVGVGGALRMYRPDGATYTSQYMGAGGTGGFAWDNQNADGFKWLFTGSEAMRLTSTGLGIGTSSPDAGVRLTVAKNDGIIQIQRATGSAYPFSFGIASDGRFNIYNGTTASESLAITQSGNLGLGVTPSAWDSGQKVLQVSGSSFYGFTGGTVVGQNSYYNGGFKYINTAAASYYQQIGASHQWYTAPSGTAGNAISFTQALTLDASGNLLLGKTIAAASVGNGCWLSSNGLISAVGSASTADTFNYFNSSAGVYRFYVNNSGVINATSTTITAISDQRLKENIQDIDVGLGKIMALQPRRFDWKPGKGKDIKGDRGWIAQEFEQVFPEMISTWKDEPPEGEDPYKAVNADLMPVMVKAIQEQQAIIEGMKTRLAALESK